MSEHLPTPQDREEELESSVTHRLAKSREPAVDSIVSGLKLGACGVGALGVGWFESTSLIPFGSVLFGFGFGGAGLLMIGRALPHLWRYGHTWPTLLVGAVSGLGAAALLIGLSATPIGIPLLLEVAATLSVMGFAAFIAVVTIGALIRWLWTSDKEDSEHLDPSVQISVGDVPLAEKDDDDGVDAFDSNLRRQGLAWSF